MASSLSKDRSSSIETLRLLEIANNVLDGLSKIWDKVGQAKEVVQSIANERELFLLLSKEFTSVHIIVIDDLERMSDDINLEDIFGIIEELKQ